MNLPQLIVELLNATINVTLTKAETPCETGRHQALEEFKGQVVFSIPGFYKHGEMYLVPAGDAFLAVGRYGSEGTIRDMNDLLSLQLSLWKTYRNDGCWSNPDPHWLPLLLQAGLVRAVNTTSFV